MDINQHIKRPARNEDEDDLLRLQSQFLQEKGKPAASVVHPTSQKKRKGVSYPQEDADNRPKIKDNHDVPMTLDIQIVERDVSAFSGKMVQPPNVSNRLSFPKPVKLIASDSGEKGQSLFAKQFGLKRQ